MKTLKILLFSCCIAIILTALVQAEQPKIDLNRMNWGQSLPLGANITFNNGYIHNLKNGTAPQDAVTLSQLTARSGANYYVSVGPYSWCDYVTDGTQDEVQINQAINSLNKTGGTVLLAKGYLYIDNPIMISKSNITLQGDNTTLKSVSTTKDIIKILGTSSSPCTHLNFYDINFDSTVTKTGGWCINGTYTYHITLDSIRAPKQRAWTGLYGGFKFVHFDNIVINRLFLVHSYKGIVVADGSSFWLGEGSRVMCVSPPPYDTIGVEFAGYTGGVQIEDTDIINNDIGVRISKSIINQANMQIFLGHCWIDSSRRWGIFVDDGALNDGYLGCDGCWMSSSGLYDTNPIFYAANGLSIGGGNQYAQILLSGCKIYNNRGSGIIINSGYGCISGCQITNNGINNANGGDGVTFIVAAHPWTFTGNVISGNGNGARGYGLSLGGTTSCCVVGNVFWANGQGQVTGAGTNSHVTANALT